MKSRWTRTCILQILSLTLVSGHTYDFVHKVDELFSELFRDLRTQAAMRPVIDRYAVSGPSMGLQLVDSDDEFTPSTGKKGKGKAQACIPATEPKSKVKSQAKSKSKSKRQHKCDECRKTFARPVELRDHKDKQCVLPSDLN